MLQHKFAKIATIICILVLTYCFISLPMTALAVQNAAKVNIIINGQQIPFLPGDQAPAIITGRTYVPIRVISENLGAQVEWKASSRQVLITSRTPATVAVPANPGADVQIIIDGQILFIPKDYGKAYISNLGRTMIPLRAVGEALGCEVNWENGTVDIKATTAVVTPEENPPTDPGTEPKPEEPKDNDSTQILKKLAEYRTNLKLINGSVVNSADLLNRDSTVFSAEQMAAFQTYLEQLSKYQTIMTLPDGSVMNTADLTILGDAYLTADQLNAWMEQKRPQIETKMNGMGRAFNEIPDLAELYIRIGEEYGVRGDLAFCQAAKETGYWQFTGSVQPWQNNYCGLSATGSPACGEESLNGADPNQVSFQAGVHGAVFTSPEAGVEAHIQHLYAYANKQALPAGKVIVDPRYSLVSKGIAPTWQKLNARWAVPGTTYGQSILFDYWLSAAGCE